MAIRYSKHADRRLTERGIPKTWLETTIANPDRETADPRDPGLTRAYKRLPEAAGHVLRVVYIKSRGDTVIITAFLDRDAE